MRYLGGKSRTRKKIATAIKWIALVNGLKYAWDATVGGGWIVQELNQLGIFDQVYGSDYNDKLIALWKKVEQGWIPPTDVSEEMYRDIKDNPEQYPDHLVAFVAVSCSYGGKWFGGYARGENRNWAAESSRTLVKQAKMLQGVRFFHADFMNSCPPEKRMLIYADPPYQGTTEYDAFDSTFDSALFWDKVRKFSRQGHVVVVSEYSAPDNFTCILEMDHVTGLQTSVKNGSKHKRVEKLFRYAGV